MTSTTHFKRIGILGIVLVILHVQRLHHFAIMTAFSREYPEELSYDAFQSRLSSTSTKRFPKFMQQYFHSYETSHFLELDHCSLDAINWTNFTSWARPILNEKAQTKASPALGTYDNETASKIQDEWMLELLEIYATHLGLCDFQKFRFNIQKNNRQIQKAGLQLKHTMSQRDHSVPTNHARIAYAIVAFQDPLHLQRLIEAIYMPHHIIVVHLEEGADLIFQEQVNNIIKQYANVVTVQFGTIIYKTDSVSRTNLQIMNWLVNDLQLVYDYHVTVGGAVYPLYSASELSQILYNSSTNVWLGELTHKGQRVHHDQWGVLWQKKLVASSIKTQAKVGFLFKEQPPAWMQSAMQHKSSSGNQAIYSYSVVQQILSHPQILEMFALAKYGCCCCIEERIWIAAMDILGYLEEAKKNVAMFQLWGGDTQRCRGSMQNAILDRDYQRCFRSENPEEGELYFYGNETWNRLVSAKSKGVLFARKFHSNHNGSVELLNDIREHLHHDSKWGKKQ